jgi:hypothetical protein
MSDGVRKRSVNEWRAASLRVTAFPAPGAMKAGRDLWGELALGEASSHERKKGGEETFQGPALDNWLVITSNLGRTDWLFLPDPTQDGAPFPDLGSFPEAVGVFLGLVRNWFGNNCPGLDRFAFGAEVRLPVETRVAGYRQLSCYLPFPIDGETSSDFLYQINRRRASSVRTDVEINRLTKWSVAGGMKLNVPFLPVLPESSAVVQSSEVGHACRIDLDINSAQGLSEPLRPEQVGRLLEEFVQMASEIVQEGDIQ